MKASIKVHGWKSSGPVYETTIRRSGFSNRKRRFESKLHGERRGRNSHKPDFALIDAGGLVALFNKGHEYDLDLEIDGSSGFVAVVNALDGYAVFRLAPGMNLVDVRPHVPSGDDEDGPLVVAREVASDEEE